MRLPTIALTFASLFAIPGPARADVIEIRGKVVDAATGKPITSFVEQGGMLREGRVEWGFWEKRSGSPIVGGTFTANIDWAKGDRMRIHADGYTSQPVLTEIPPPGVKTLDIVVEMTRGRPVKGSIVDADNKPVKGAAVFLIGKRPANITGGKAVLGIGGDGGEDKSVTRTLTDADGQFTLTGVGEDVDRVVVSTPGLDLFIVAAPDDLKAKVAIRLPRPAKLVIRYDVAGGPADAKFLLQMYTHEIPTWSGIDNLHEPMVRNGGEIVLANLAPGKYGLSRIKIVTVGDRGQHTMLDRREFTIKSGETRTEAIVREEGAVVTGKVEGIDLGKVAGAFVTVCPAVATADLDNTMKRLTMTKFDGMAAKADGTFSTERLAPGEYTIVVEAYAKPDPNNQRFSRRDLPTLLGMAKVTVPKKGSPTPVTVTLKPPNARGAK